MSTTVRHVLILNYEFPPMGGGAGHASWEFAKRLVAQGCFVDVVTSGLEGQPAMEWLSGMRVHRVRSRRRSVQECGFLGAFSYVAAARGVVRQLIRAEHYDVVHYFFGLPTGLLRFCTPGLSRIPCVVSLRGSDVPGYDSLNMPLQLVHRLLKPLTRRIWRKAGAVVALSESLRAQALRTLPQASVEIIPNGIDVTRFHPAQAASSDGGHPVQLLSVARLIRRKGLDDLLRAVALLKDEPVHLTIQGTGRDEAALQALSVQLGIAERVSFMGFRVRDLLPPVYQAADVFVMPSHSESFGLAVLEAMACGLPVVVSSVGGMVEYVEEGVNGLLVPPGDAAALASALRRLIRDVSLRRSMGQANAQKAAQQFPWERVAQSYMEIYRRLMSQSNGAVHASG